jgi:hypothetical protein
MPTLNINGHSVSVGDEFLQLSPDQQNATVDEIAKSLPQQAAPQAKVQPSITDAITDIPAEIGRTADANLSAVTDNLSNRGANTSPFGFLNTGKAVLGGLGLMASPVTGAMRSLIGHPMAQAEHAVGTFINPEVAAKDDPQKMYQNAAGDVETALSAARPAGFSPVGALAPRSITVAPPSSADLKAAYKSVYDSPAIKSIAIPPQDVSLLSSKIQSDLANQGFRPSTGSAPGTFAEINRLTPPQGVTGIGIDDIVAARRALGMTAKQLDPATFTATPDAAAASKSISHINDFLDTLAPELKTANANYAAAKSADRLDYRLAKAERRAARSGIGGNLENTMRQEADKIPDRGLTPDELALRDQIVMGTTTRNALRTAGKAGVDGGLSLMMHLGAGLGSGGATAPITVAGTAARKIGELLTRRQMGDLSTMIRNRAPLAVSNQAQQAVAQALFGNTPSSAAALIPMSEAMNRDPRKAAIVQMLLSGPQGE